ncbi:MAG: hypothetical protein V9G09_12040 [Candidatus Nanopelagicales bacterium]
MIDPTADERWMRTYAQWLGDGAGPWASVQMGLLPIDGPANRQMRAFEGPGHKRFWVRDLASLDLTDSFDAFLDRPEQESPAQDQTYGEGRDRKWTLAKGPRPTSPGLSAHRRGRGLVALVAGHHRQGGLQRPLEP